MPRKKRGSLSPLSFSVQVGALLLRCEESFENAKLDLAGTDGLEQGAKSRVSRVKELFCIHFSGPPVYTAGAGP